MYDPIDGNEAFIKQMEEDSKAELAEMDKPEDVEPPAEHVDEPTDDQVDEPKDDEEEDTGESDALSDDEKKRARAFAKQRNEAKQAKEEAAAASKELAEMRERLARIEGRTESLQPKAEVPLQDQEPDRDLYPDDHRDWELRQVKKELEDIKKFRHSTEQETQYYREQQAVTTLENQYKATAPDYDDAVKFLLARERETKKLLNPNMTDAQVEQQIQLEKVGLFKQLAMNGQNPAEIVYKIAKRDGFIGKQPAPKPRVDLDRIAENQRKSASLIGGSSAAPTSTKLTTDQVFNQMSNEQLFGMSDSDWNKVMNSAK